MKENEKFKEKIVIRDYPYSIAIEVTAYCNLRCSICANSTMKRQKGFMDIELFKKIVDEVGDRFPQSNIWMNGYGESLLHKDFITMLKYAVKTVKNKIFLNTNAMLLNEKNIDALIESGIEGIVVSLDGFSKEVYESVRVGADREVVYQNVLNMLNKIKGEKPVFELQFIEMPEIMHEKEIWYEFWKDKGANIKFKPYITWGGILEVAKENSINRVACGDCNILDIFWNGMVSFCATGDVECEFVLGDVTKESLYEIWHRKKQNFCQYHIKHEFDKLPVFCRECSDWCAIPAKHIKSRK